MKKVRHGKFLIAKIHQLSGRIFTKKFKKYQVGEINPAQGRILNALWKKDGISIQELADITSLGKSTLTSMLDRLEQIGHIKRVACEKDKRKILIFVDKERSRIMEDYQKVIDEMVNVFYKDFTEEEIDEFESYLERVFHNLAEHEKQK